MLYLRNLVQFGPAKDMFDSKIPVVKQFLAGATEGPIGMSEEADQGKGGDGIKAASTYGLTAEETERLERDAGAPEDDIEAHRAPRDVTDRNRVAKDSTQGVA
jgi:phospholipid/cholesterol/gamma-HCH transport system ATP-binding protein